MTTSFVLGSGGLLGSEVQRLCDRTFRSHLSFSAPVPWDEPDAVARAVRGVVDSVGSDDRTLVAFWCAGVGHVGSSDDELAATTDVLVASLDELTRGVERGLSVHLSYASSAGAVWAGSSELPITESTPTAPIHPYGRAKLLEEDLVTAWGTAHAQNITIARISNLFGENQDPAKPQGLITKLVAGALRGEPTPIFVPLDTGRDFLPARTAAEMLVADAAEVAAATSGPEVTTRILASGQSHTIAQVCGVLQRLRRRRVPLVHVVSDQTLRQPARLEFRTDRPFDDVAVPSLEESLRMMYDDETRRLAASA
ncbi:MAG: NAD-dependent epimerase/dehydratase family protein [Actinomycetota bacterium]